ncbi:DCL family protein [Delftia tsuruhatensis]|uniref:DCL family protein n=1 Tax=Delftia lacustris TaxID=558537 RepID=A0A7T2YX83_9BURK|nr:MULTISPECIES: DCL family protein [Delftia]MDH0850132.1 DCL family protein [Delftia tsuruhatensis]QPS83637.1 DCL family protein [Delftia lacustris]
MIDNILFGENMGKAKPIFLTSGRHWSKKGDALAHFKGMLSRYSVGDRISDPSDHADLAALLAIYDSVLTAGEPTKVGCGVSYFEKRWDMDHPGHTACFFVVRTDGTSIDFSTIKALDVAAGKAS